MALERTVISINRFGLGARPHDLAAIGADYEDWLLSQLAGNAPAPGGLASSRQILEDLEDNRREIRSARADGSQQAMRLARRDNRAIFQSQYRAQVARRYEIATSTDQPFRERLVHFWTNHFAVSADKQPLPALAGTLENEAIRPHVTGRFQDMLMAVEKHPAMITYLDNQRSMGPESQRARMASRRGRNLGLNENLAREILELHTLGVDGGYSQADVTTFAKVLTGWSVGSSEARDTRENVGAFVFRRVMHEPGPKTILGRRYAENGVAEGEAVLVALALAPATARFLSTKLARHFVADDPPPALVDRLASVYLETEGDLAAVYTALVRAAEPWARPFAKYKSPEDFVVSTFRAFDRQPENPERILSFLQLLGQRPYTPGSPAGWSDTASRWDGSDALIRRIEWGDAVSRAIGDRSDPVGLGDAILGPLLGDHTRTAVARAESAAQGLTLLLASPEFQRR